MTSFPNIGTSNSGLTSSLVATPNTGYFFSNWDFDNNTPLSNATSNNISVTWTSNDTCYVNFALIPDYNITYVTNPTGAGTIDINAINFSGFPFKKNPFSGSKYVHLKPIFVDL